MNPALNIAFDHYQTAEHLFRTTLPVAKNPKILVGIIKSISNSLEYAISSILTQEKMVSPQGLFNKINALRPIAEKHRIAATDILFFLKIHEILYHQEHSPVEFKRGSSHVICSEDYSLEVLTEKDIEKFLKHTKKVLNQLKQHNRPKL